MATHGDRLASTGSSFARSGVGLPTPPKQQNDPHAWRYIAVADFSGGYDSSMIDEVVKAGSSPFMLDLDIDPRGRLVKMPGISTLETLTHTPTEMFAHASLNDSLDIVFISDNWLGIRQVGVTTWYDAGLPSGGGWVSCLHGETLLLSNNTPHTDVWARAQLATSLTQLGWGEAGTLLSFAGRVYAANCNIGGIHNPLGIKWTGSSGEVTDVNGVGAGFELLLQDSAENDRIVALRELGFDLMVLVLRKSLWVGVPTSDPNRPVDFRPRINGAGAVCEQVVRSVEGGVMFLADDGVKLFDGNQAKHVSGPIDSDLLPLDYTKLSKYSASYNPSKQLYTLHTPTDTWYYSLHYDRWLRSSAVITRSLGIFNPFTQSYDSLQAGWGLDWNGFWSDAPSSGISALFDDALYLKGNLIGRPDSSISTYFGVTQNPVWTSPRADGLTFDTYTEFDRFDFEYEGAANIDIRVPDRNGIYNNLFKTHALAPSTSRNHAKAYGRASGLGLGCSLSFTHATTLKLRRFGSRYRFTTDRVNTP